LLTYCTYCKLLDICRNLPTGATIGVELDGERVIVRSGRSRFTLVTLPPAEFPVIDEVQAQVEFQLAQAELKRAIDRIGFAMAQQDVRYYLNGLLFELAGDRLRTVATDGHRLSTGVDPRETSDIEAMEQWAVENGCSLAPALDRHDRHSVVTGDDSVVTLPVVCVACREDDRLVGVYPHVGPSGHCTVADGLDRIEAAIRSGEPLTRPGTRR